MRARFTTYHSYAEATFENSFLPEELDAAYVVRSERFASSYLEDLGNGKFNIQALPTEAQVSPIFGIAVQDYNEDGNLDVLWTGNFYAVEAAAGPRDASLGGLLLGDGTGNFSPVSPTQTGFIADGDARGIAQLLSDGRLITVVANNNQPLGAFSRTFTQRTYQATHQDAFATITLADGKSYQHEFTFGSAYLSQSSRTLLLPATTQRLQITTYQGEQREVKNNDLITTSIE